MIDNATRIARSKSYEDLTYEEKALICGGCGSKNGLKVPDFIFRECCDIHDYEYTKGRTEKDRETADRAFLSNMLKEAGVNFFYRMIAHIYHFAVSFKKRNSNFAYS